MIQNQKSKIAIALAGGIFFGFLLCGTLPVAHADRIWWDGSRDTENAPPGKLLSDNAGYWGASVQTGVTYRYDARPDNPGDVIGGTETFGNRLLNGVPAGSWYEPIGAVNRPLVPIFDFKRICTFNEVDISTRSNRVALKIEVADVEAGPWRIVYDRPLEQSPDKMFQRVPLTAKPTDVKPTGRYLRLTVNAVSLPAQIYTTFLEEVIVWGDAAAKSEVAETVVPSAPAPNVIRAALSSIPGVAQTTFSDIEFWKWQTAIGAAAKSPAVWSQVPTWDRITDKPLLPPANAIAKPVQITMARNETEHAALALTNTSLQNPKTDKITLSAFQRIGGARATKKSGAPTIRGQVRVAGVIVSREHGTNVGPLFSADNLLGPGQMGRYLTNGESIKNFPRLSLAPAGAAVLWVEVKTEGAAPGRYQARLHFGAGNPVTIQVEVLDVTLPKPFVWLNTWSGTTEMFPFVYGDRLSREVDYKQSLGITVWNDLPTPGTAAAIAHKRGRTFHQPFILPEHYSNVGFNGILKPEAITAKDETAISEHIRAFVKRTKDLGLTYDDWAGELWDEPGRNSAPTMGALARIIKKADPKVRIYVNPSFWEGNGYAPSEVVQQILAPWYSELVDVSSPHEGLMHHPVLKAPRFVNAFYGVSTRGAKGEDSQSVQYYRQQAWTAFSRGWNGWGFYSYFAPRGNPWNDFDGAEPEYQMVYPGPRGPVPTRQSEVVRQGWEDYRLLTLLKTRGRNAEIDALIKGYWAGESLEKLRLQALRAAVKR